MSRKADSWRRPKELSYKFWFITASLLFMTFKKVHAALLVFSLEMIWVWYSKTEMQICTWRFWIKRLNLTRHFYLQWDKNIVLVVCMLWQLRRFFRSMKNQLSSIVRLKTIYFIHQTDFCLGRTSLIPSCFSATHNVFRSNTIAQPVPVTVLDHNMWLVATCRDPSVSSRAMIVFHVEPSVECAWLALE